MYVLLAARAPCVATDFSQASILRNGHVDPSCYVLQTKVQLLFQAVCPRNGGAVANMSWHIFKGGHPPIRFQRRHPPIRSHFGTSPEPWNYLLKGMTLLPDSIMGNRDLMQALAEFSEPLVRITDKLVR